MRLASSLPWFSLAAVASAVDELPPADALERVALTLDGVQGNWNSVDFGCTLDGRFWAIASFASNLVEFDGNEWADGGCDVFVLEREYGSVERVSVTSAGDEANGCSYGASLSDTARFVVFQSYATNLVPGDSNGEADLFLRDRDADGNGDFDGRHMTTTRVSSAIGGGDSDGHSFGGTIVRDGSALFFSSYATNLVAGDTNGFCDVFRRDLATGVTTRVSTAADGTQSDGESSAPKPSADGTKLLFLSTASNLVAGDGNGQHDVFLRDLATGTVERISVATGGLEGNGPSTSIGGMSDDGRYVLFGSYATNLVADDGNGQPDVFVRDRLLGTTVRVSVASDGTAANDRSFPGAIAADGSRVAFTSHATNLDPQDDDDLANVFWRDLATGVTQAAVTARDGSPPNDHCSFACATPDLSQLGFIAWATNLVSWDSNATDDRRGEEPYVRRIDVEIGTASWRPYGDGLLGTRRPFLIPRTPPVLGTTVTFELHSSATYTTTGFIVAGSEATAIPMRGGLLANDGQLVVLPVVLDISGGTTYDADIADDPSLQGISIFAQLAMFDVMTPRGLSLSEGIELALGR